LIISKIIFIIFPNFTTLIYKYRVSLLHQTERTVWVKLRKMKINVTVDLSNFYSEDESSFSEQIKSAIAYDVKKQVLNDFKEKLTNDFTFQIAAEIAKEKESLITSVLKDLCINAKVKQRYSTKEQISIVDYITEELERTQLSGNAIQDFLSKQVKQSTDNISKELKSRYDILFASQIVSKLHENGLLKENVAQLLLDNK